MTRPCCKRSRCGTTFSAQMGKWRTAIASSMCWAIFSDIAAKEQCPLKGQKETSRTYCKHSRHLSVCGQYRKRSSAKISRHCHQVNCFQQGMLEFEGPMGQCFSRFLTVSSRRRGEKRKKDTGLTGRVNESK